MYRLRFHSILQFLLQKVRVNLLFSHTRIENPLKANLLNFREKCAANYSKVKLTSMSFGSLSSPSSSFHKSDRFLNAAEYVQIIKLESLTSYIFVCVQN